MSETTWENRKLHEADRGELEIKATQRIPMYGPHPNYFCVWKNCKKVALNAVIVGFAGRPQSAKEFFLCDDDNDDERPFELFRESCD